MPDHTPSGKKKRNGIPGPLFVIPFLIAIPLFVFAGVALFFMWPIL